jgi:L-asparagine transporter-like permease
MSALATAGAGFLLAVLWMDLMFDVQVLRHRGEAPALPEPVLASIAGYYRRVTTEAGWMSHAIAAAMAATIGALVAEWLRGARPAWVSAVCLALAAAPVALAGLRVFPNAVRLGARRDATEEQSRLARAIYRDHLVCLVAIGGLTLLRVAL